jgi:hypothetical protein
VRFGTGEAVLDVFTESVRERVRAARRGLAAAAETQDPSVLARALDELEDAICVARANGVAFPSEAEAESVEAELTPPAEDER